MGFATAGAGRMSLIRSIAGAVIAVTIVAGTARFAPAEARIVCDEGYRVIKGQKLATPYCMDVYLAQVAREYGTRVSARTILNNPSKKREVCEFVGQDIRVKNICDLVLPRRGGF